MKKTLLALTILALLTPGLSLRAEESAPAVQAEVAKPRLLPFHGTIAAVDSEARSFSLSGKSGVRIFKVTQETRMTKGAEAAIWEDLKVGELVRGSAVRIGEREYRANSVKIGEATAEEKAASEARKTQRSAKKTEPAAPAEPAPQQ